MPTQGVNPWGCKAEGVGARYSKTPTLCPKPKIKIENEIKEVTTMDELSQLIQKGYVLYQKNGKIEVEDSPTFGSITLHFQDGRFSYLQRCETKK